MTLFPNVNYGIKPSRRRSSPLCLQPGFPPSEQPRCLCGIIMVSVSWILITELFAGLSLLPSPLQRTAIDARHSAEGSLNASQIICLPLLLSTSAVGRRWKQVEVNRISLPPPPSKPLLTISSFFFYPTPQAFCSGMSQPLMCLTFVLIDLIYGWENNTWSALINQMLTERCL